MRIRLRPKYGSAAEPGKIRFQRLPVERALGEEIEIQRAAMSEAQGQRRSPVEAISHLLQGCERRPEPSLGGRKDVTPGPEGHRASLTGSGEDGRRSPSPARC